MTATADTETTRMSLGYDAQRAYCAALGILPVDRHGSPSESIDAWYDSAECQEVSGLLDAMRTQLDKMTAAAKWVRSYLDDNDRELAAPEVHTVSIRSLASAAVEHDTAAAAYAALQDRLSRLVYKIRTGQGYEPDAWARLEAHPALSPQDDRTVRELAKLERHLSEFRGSGVTYQRRHLRDDHGTRTGAQDPAGPGLLHDGAHAGELAGLRARADVIDAGTCHCGARIHAATRICGENHTDRDRATFAITHAGR